MSRNRDELKDLPPEKYHETEWFKDLAVSVALSQLPSLLVQHGLDDLFLEDELQAISKLYDILENSPMEVEVIYIVHDDFPVIKEKIIEKIENLDEFDVDEEIMILFYATSSFESMVNHHYKEELKLRELSESDISKIHHLSPEAKLGWLLKLICGKKYTENKNWKTIKRFFETRNFFIHYRPVREEIYSNHKNVLKKESFYEFLDAANDCYLFLKECHSDEYKKEFGRIDLIDEIIKSKYQ